MLHRVFMMMDLGRKQSNERGQFHSCPGYFLTQSAWKRSFGLNIEDFLQLRALHYTSVFNTDSYNVSFFQIFSHEYIVSSIYLIRSLNFQINEEIKFKMMKPFDKNGIVVCGYGYTQCNLSLVHMQSLSFSKLTKMSTMCFVLSVT